VCSSDLSTGVVTFKTAPDFNAPQDSGKDNVYDLRVRISDGRIGADQNIAITLIDGAPSPPSINSAKSVSVIENVANSTPVYKVTGTDADPAAALTYSMAGGRDKTKFTIDPKTGEIKFLSSPDFENPLDSGGDNVYDITVEVTDGLLVEQQAVTIVVTDANDNAPIITSPPTAQVKENISITTPVYRVTSTDVDSVGTPTYSIIGGLDKDRFLINPTTGDLTFKTAPD
jgi:VCBS repeat-containing protein